VRLAFLNYNWSVVASNIDSSNLESPVLVLKDAIVPVEDWRFRVCLGIEENYPPVLALKTQGEIKILSDHFTKFLIIRGCCARLCKPHRVNDSMHKFEASSLGYCDCTVEEYS
jgi:hypothetical protein